MANARFYNKMPFEIKMRAMWLPNNPPIILQPGGIIEGPYDFLSQYVFLQFIPVDFHRVESIIQGPDYVFKDELLPQNNEVRVVTGLQVPETITETKQEEQVEQKTENQPVEQQTDETLPTELPFDPSTVNWLGVKIEQLETAAKVLKINISHLKDVKPKEKKWALVKLVKDATINKQ
jgi:hypothetical protein